jgi:hypothetical protein
MGDLGAQPDGGEGRLDAYLGSFLIHLIELGFRVVDVLTDVVGGGFSAVDYRLRGGAARRAAGRVPEASAPAACPMNREATLSIRPISPHLS